MENHRSQDDYLDPPGVSPAKAWAKVQDEMQRRLHKADEQVDQLGAQEGRSTFQEELILLLEKQHCLLMHAVASLGLQVATLQQKLDTG